MGKEARSLWAGGSEDDFKKGIKLGVGSKGEGTGWLLVENEQTT